jgi:hypothetical protein
LASLQRNVNILRSSLDATKHLSSEDLEQIRSLLNPSDQALSRVYQNLILDGLRFEKMNDRFDDVKEAHLKTFSWILGRSDDNPDYSRVDLESVDSGIVDDAYNDPHGEGYPDRQDYLQSRLQVRDSFVNWLEKGSGIFHISGKPGAGKSTLMKYLCQHPQTEKHIKVWSSRKDLVIAKFFFWRPGTEFQKSLKGLLRGLLHCILDQVPELTQSTFPTQWESAKYQRSIQFNQSEIQQAFKSLVEKETVFDNHKFVFFIDGLDEFEGKHDDMIRTLLSWVSMRPNDLKICVSSREELIFQERFSKCPKMRLHELTRYDIARFVQETLKANEEFQSANVSEDTLAGLQKQIIEKSEGVFLWVSLALRTLEQGLLAEDRVTDLEKKIDSLPPELDDLFEFIFDSITKRSHPIDCRNAIRTLAVATNLPPTWRSLPLTRYSFLEEYQDDQDFAIKRQIHDLTDDNMRQRLRRARKQVYSRCRGILEVVSRSKFHGIPFRKEVVKLTHRSLAEYLQKEAIQERMAPYLAAFDLLDFHCQTLVAELKSVQPNMRQYFTGGVSGFELDIHACFRLFWIAPPTNSIRFCRFVDQLAIVAVARVPTGTLGCIIVFFLYSTGFATGIKRSMIVTNHPSECLQFYAAGYGLYEYLSTRPVIGMQFDRFGRYQGFDRDGILQFALQVVGGNKGLLYKASQDRMTKTLGYCFEHFGISANTKGGLSGDGTCWQLVLWALMATRPSDKAPDLEFEPLIRVFLLYGADPNFYLDFRSRFTRKDGEEFVRVFFKVEREGNQPFNSVGVYVHSTDGIVRLAEGKGRKLSLREIVEYWFPKRYKVLQELIDRNAARGVPQQGELDELKGKSGMDLDVWKGLTYETDKCLFSQGGLTFEDMEELIV